MGRPPNPTVPPPVPEDDSSGRPDETRRLARPTPPVNTEEAVTNRVSRGQPAPPPQGSRSTESVTLLQGLAEQISTELTAVSSEAARQRSILLYELGHLEETILSRAESSLAHYREAYQQDATFVPALRALGRRLTTRGSWEELVEVLLAELEVITGEEPRSALMTRLAQVHAFRLSDTDEAIRILRAALDLNPRDHSAACTLHRVYARLEQWEQLLEVLRIMSGVASSAEERARLLVEMAEISELRQGRLGHAEGLYSQALELAPRSETALLALRRLLYAHRRWSTLCELLTSEGQRKDDVDQQFSDLCRAARISEHYLQDDGRAAELLEQGASLRPTHPLPVQALTAIYQRTGRYQALTAALGRHFRLVDSAAERASLCYRRGRVYEDWLDQPEQAVNAYREALREEPGHEATIRALAALYGRLARFQELLDLELLRAERCQDAPRRAEGYLRAAVICEQQIKDRRRAVDLYERAYRLQPKQASAFRALQRLYRRSGRWDSLAELYEREAEVLDDKPMAMSLLRSAARIHEQMLEDRQRAIATLEKLDRITSDNHETLISLARLYEETGGMEQLAGVLQTWAEATSDPGLSTELRRHLAELLEGPLRKPDKAVALYHEILQETPGDRPTLDRLKAYFERTGRWADLIKILAQEQEPLTDGKERAPLLLQVGQIYQHKLGQVEQACEAFEEAMAADPGFTPAQQSLEDLLRNQGLWERLLELLEAGAKRTHDPALAASRLHLAAEICEEQFRDSIKARALFERALELDGRLGPAWAGLERIHLAADDLAALEALYLQGASRGASKTTRVRCFLRLGSLLDGQGEDRRAVEAYESALSVQPDQPDALLALVRLHRRRGKWEAMCKSLARITGLAMDADADQAAVRECAEVVETHLADLGDAGPLFERLLEGDSRDFHALASLERRAYARRDLASLCSLARFQRDAGGEPEWLATLCLRAAMVTLVREQDLPAAAETLSQGLEICPTYLPIIWLLRSLEEQLKHWKEAARLLQEEGKLCFNRRLAHAALLRAGDIFKSKFDDRVAAQQAFERVFNEDPSSDQAFTRLAAILTDAEEWRPLAEAFRRRLAALPPSERPPVLTDLAAVYRDHLLDPVAAVDVLEELLAIEPEHAEAIVSITELCVALKRWRDAERYLERLAMISERSARTRRAAMIKRARILEEQLQDPQAALAVLSGLLAEVPGDREALTRSAAIYQSGRDWENMVAVLDELVRSGPAPERIHHLVTLADICYRFLRDERRGRGAMRRAASIAVQTGAGIDRINEIFERRRDHKGLVAFWGKALDGLPPEGSPGAVPVRLARARVMSSRLLQEGEAESEIRRALEHDPTSVPARLELAALQLRNGAPGDANSEYMRVLDHDPFCLDAFRGLFHVFERRGDKERAAGAAQAVCFVAEQDVQERSVASRAAAAVEAALARPAPSRESIADMWHLVMHPGEPQVAPELLVLIGDQLPQILAAEVQRFEERVAGNVELVRLTDSDPLGRICSQLARVMGVDGFQQWTGELPSLPAVVLPGAPPRLVLDHRLLERAPGGRVRFIIGRALAEVSTRSFYLSALEPAVTEQLFFALVELFVRGYAARLGRGRDAEELGRAVSKALPRKLRKKLEEPVRSYAELKPISATRWITAATRSAERAGVMVCGDAEAALLQLRDEQASAEVMGELLRFVVGPHLYEARRRLRLIG